MVFFAVRHSKRGIIFQLREHSDRVCFQRCRTHITHNVRGVIDKFVFVFFLFLFLFFFCFFFCFVLFVFFHRIIIYGWIYIIFCHYQQQSIVNRKKTLICKVRQTCDVTMTLMMSHVGDVVEKTPKDRCGWCTLSGYKWYSTNAIVVKFSDNVCTEVLKAAQVNLIQFSRSCRMQGR